MPYKTHFQHERDPKFQERMREMWRNKKRRQRRKRALAAKKAKEEGHNVPRDPNVFIRTRSYPNKAMWLFDRELRQSRAQGRLIDHECIRRMWRLKTTHYFIRTEPKHGIRYRMAFSILGLGVRRRGTLKTRPKRNTPRSSSYVDRGRSPELRMAPLATQVLKVTVMADQQSKIDPTKPMGEAEKYFLEACAQADAVKGTPAAREKAQREAEVAAHRAWIAKRMRTPMDRLTPGENEKQRKIDAMRKALAESEAKEKTAKKEDADGGAT